MPHTKFKPGTEVFVKVRKANGATRTMEDTWHKGIVIRVTNTMVDVRITEGPFKDIESSWILAPAHKSQQPWIKLPD